MTLSPQPASSSLPAHFVYLADIDPTIVQEVRYAMHHNFVGRPIVGYERPIIIMTEPAAIRLKRVQDSLRPFGLSLKVYDAYRPQRAVDAFLVWSQDPTDQVMKLEFYPAVDKSKIFEEGYLLAKSHHSQGSTVDLTIIPSPTPFQPPWKPGDAIIDGRSKDRFPDNSIEMGTGFDCLDEMSHTFSNAVSAEARANRLLLRSLMESHGFKGIGCEWWHFVLKEEAPYPDTYFDFIIK